MGLEDCASRADVIKKFRVHEKDSGSPEVQIALLTKRMDQLSGHFKKHSKDLHSQRGMLTLISERKRLLAYLRRESVDRYKTLIAALGIRK